MDYAPQERLGHLLVKAGLIDDAQLASALAEQSRSGGRLGEILVRELLATEEQIADVLARQQGLQHVSLTTYPIDRAAVKLISERVARRRRILPLDLEGGVLTLAMADPLDIQAIDDVEMATGFKVVPVVASPTQIGYAIDKYLASADAFEEIAEAAEAPVADESAASADDVPIVRIVNQFIRDAVHDGASDIHFEPQETGMRVRFRIDGVLQDVAGLPRTAIPGVVSRLKIMADMDIAERRRPQDGRIGVKVDGRTVDLRVASLPTPYGESIVVRILNSELAFLSLGQIGVSDHDLATLGYLFSRPYGAVLVCGPTGSGKSTTLYAAVHEVNDPGKKIITVEDPIEYRMAGVTQIAINPRIGLTFAAGLRTILRSDPDIVMVGEIRDPETAEMAIRSALTGHLVLSSIHTNDAPSALTRLQDMGVPGYITSSAVLGVVAQRLARRLCPACKQPQDVPLDVLLAHGFGAEEAQHVTVYGAVGCDQCRNTGYKGRIGLFEIMVMDEEITRLSLEGAPVDLLREAAIASGMRPLRRDALDKVAAGHTSLEEIDRVVI